MSDVGLHVSSAEDLGGEPLKSFVNEHCDAIKSGDRSITRGSRLFEG